MNNRAIEALVRWREHPSQFVRECLGAEPDAWQVDVLEAFPHRPRLAMSACKGPGKTTVLSWLALCFLCTRVDAKVIGLSATSDTLKDTFWRELAYWHSKSDFLKACFTVHATSVDSKERPQTWNASARSFPRNANPQQQADALAGVHGNHVLFILDEASSIPRSVLATADAALSGGGDQHLVLAGNPTNQDSALGYAVLQQRHHWHVTEITGDPDDPKRAPRVDPQWARQQIEAWGRDNPWVLVNVFGKFPPSGLNTLLSPQEVLDAQKRGTTQNPGIEAAYADYPLIIGADIARFGDDEIVFFPRRGRIAYNPYRMRNLDGIQVAGHLSDISNRLKADSVQIDTTGGFGTVLDVYKTMQPNGLPVGFGNEASDKRRFKNKRAEITWKMADWVKDGGMLPKVDEMVTGLSTMTYTYDLQGRIQIEEKEQIKARIGRSPDLEDALACTFAWHVQVAPKHVIHGSLSGANLAHLLGSAGELHRHEYDPFEKYAQETR